MGRISSYTISRLLVYHAHFLRQLHQLLLEQTITDPSQIEPPRRLISIVDFNNLRAAHHGYSGEASAVSSTILRIKQENQMEFFSQTQNPNKDSTSKWRSRTFTLLKWRISFFQRHYFQGRCYMGGVSKLTASKFNKDNLLFKDVVIIFTFFRHNVLDIRLYCRTRAYFPWLALQAKELKKLTYLSQNIKELISLSKYYYESIFIVKY